MAEVSKPLPDNLRNVLTRQELALRGEIETYDNLNVYMPLDVERGLLAVDINKIRQKYGIYLIPEFISIIAVGISNPLVATLERLDPITGLTLRDPQILGEWLRDQKAIQRSSDRDFTEEVYQAFVNKNIDLFRRV